jgi:hypothetical protein
LVVKNTLPVVVAGGRLGLPYLTACVGAAAATLPAVPVGRATSGT